MSRSAHSLSDDPAGQASVDDVNRLLAWLTPTLLLDDMHRIHHVNWPEHWLTDSDELDMEVDILLEQLNEMVNHFPGIYRRAVQMMNSGQSPYDVSACLCEVFHDRYDLDTYGFLTLPTRVPLPCYALEPENEHFWNEHDSVEDAVRICQALGREVNESYGTYDLDFLHHVGAGHLAVNVLRSSLAGSHIYGVGSDAPHDIETRILLDTYHRRDVENPGFQYFQDDALDDMQRIQADPIPENNRSLFFYLSYIMHMTGSDLCDTSREFVIRSGQHLGYNRADVYTAQVLTLTADEMIQHVMRGIELLNAASERVVDRICHHIRLAREFVAPFCDDSGQYDRDSDYTDCVNQETPNPLSLDWQFLDRVLLEAPTICDDRQPGPTIP